MAFQCLTDDLLLDSTKSGFAITAENLGNRAAGSLLDSGIGVDQPAPDGLGQPPADSGLTRAGQPDQDGFRCHLRYPDNRTESASATA